MKKTIHNNKIKEFIKNNYRFYLITFVIISIFFIPCFKEHYTNDTYVALNFGLKSYGTNQILTLGRIIQYLYFILIDSIKNYKFLCIIKTIVSIVISTLNINLVYNMFKKYINNNIKKKIILYILSFVLIINPYTIELFYYIESPIMMLGMLFSLLASKSIFEKKKIKSFIYLLLCINCYQPLITVFSTLTLLYTIFDNTNYKEKIKNILYCLFEFGLVAIINLMFIYLVIPKLGLQYYKYNINALSNINVIFKFKYYIYFFFEKARNVKINLNILLSIILVIILTMLTIFSKEKNKNIKLIYVYLLIFTTFFVSLTPMLSIDVKEIYGGYRFYVGTFAIFPLTSIYILINLKTNKILNIIIYSILFIISVSLEIYILKIILNINDLNKQEKNDCIFLAEVINNYQNKTGIDINNIVIYQDIKSNKKVYDTYTIWEHVLYQSYFELYGLNYYGNLNIKENTTSSDNNYEMYIKFANRDYKYFNYDSIDFDNDTAYILLY